MPPDITEPAPPRKKRYRRLPGLRWSGAFARSVLRMSDDHLLVCDYQTGFVERYRRFYFKDIEAFIIRRTDHWLVALVVWTLIAALMLVFAWGWRWPAALTLSVEGFCALFLLREVIAGPSCRTHVQTAVQTDPLRMLKRVRKTQRVLKGLLPLIEEAQGKLDPLTLPGAQPRAASAADSASPLDLIATAPSDAPAPALATYGRSVIHLITFTLVLTLAVVSIWEAQFSSTISMTLVIILFCVTAITAVFALVRQARRRVHRGAAIISWIVVVTYLFGGVCVQTGFSIFHTILEIDKARPPHPAPAGFEPIGPFTMRHMQGFTSVLWILAVWSAILGLLGLVFAMMRSPVIAEPPPVPARTEV